MLRWTHWYPSFWCVRKCASDWQKQRMIYQKMSEAAKTLAEEKGPLYTNLKYNLDMFHVCWSQTQCSSSRHVPFNLWNMDTSLIQMCPSLPSITECVLWAGWELVSKCVQCWNLWYTYTELLHLYIPVKYLTYRSTYTYTCRYIQVVYTLYSV